MKDWRQQLDARIDICPGCDEWRWDGQCRRCDEDAEATPAIQEAA